MTDEGLAPLRDRGQRTWRRFSPDDGLVADIAMPTRRIGQRSVIDLSLGGAKLAVRARDVRYLTIGEKARLRLDLGGDSPVVVMGRIVHLQQVGSGWFGKWSVGLMFPLGYTLDQARPELIRYLTALAKARARRAA